jgi:hypothetical protein
MTQRAEIASRLTVALWKNEVMRRGWLLIGALSGCGDNVYVPYGPHHHYVVDSVELPTDNGLVGSDAVYLQECDPYECAANQFGLLLAYFAAPYGFGFGASAIEGPNVLAVDRGTLITLIDLQAADLGPTSESARAGASGFAVYQGSNPSPAPCEGPNDVVCRHHLAGTGSFDIVAGSVFDRPLVGAMIDGGFFAQTGDLALPMMLGSTPIVLPLIGARAQLSGVTDDGIATGKLGGLITQDTMDDVIVPALQSGLIAPAIARDCCGTPTSPAPSCDPNASRRCGCVPGSTGEQLIRTFDQITRDCSISVDEITNNSLFMTSLAAPDFYFERNYCHSFGLHITAVPASFTTP